MAIGSTSWWSKDTIAVVTGANKGIGYQIVRLLAKQGLTVVLTARDPARGQAAVHALQVEGLQSVFFHPLDIRSSESAENLATWLKNKFGGIDILVNNAGLSTDSAVNYEVAKDLVETNYYGVKNVTEVLQPLLRASPASARIVNLTSRCGFYERLRSESLKQMLRDEESYSKELADSLAGKYLEDINAGRGDEEGWIPGAAINGPMYSESKIFLNVYAIALAKSLSRSEQPGDHQILVASFCPGGTDTDMLALAVKGGFRIPDDVPLKTPEEGADTGVWLALLPKEEFAEKNGKLFCERNEYPFGLVVPY